MVTTYEGRRTPEATPRATLDGAGLRGALVQSGAGGDRRLRRLHAAARHRRGAARAPAERRGRDRPSVPAHDLRVRSRLVRHRRDVPARSGGGLHPDLLARGRAARVSCTRSRVDVGGPGAGIIAPACSSGVARQGWEREERGQYEEVRTKRRGRRSLPRAAPAKCEAGLCPAKALRAQERQAFCVNQQSLSASR